MDQMKSVQRGKKDKKFGKKSLHIKLELGVALLAGTARKALQAFRKKEENLFSATIQLQKQFLEYIGRHHKNIFNKKSMFVSFSEGKNQTNIGLE